MIQGIVLRGFRSHVDSEIPLVPGLNVITGPSDSGKTAVLDLVKWVAFNEPTGEAFLNKRVGSAEGIIRLANGEHITKTRRGKKTSYTVSTVPTPFEKSEVPQEVTELLGITKQTFGDYTASLNFAYQLEAPFILSETASVGAKILGKIAGTEAIDLAIKGTSKDMHGQRQARQRAEKDIETISAQLDTFTYLEGALQQYERAEELINSIQERVETFHKLRKLQDAYQRALTVKQDAERTLTGLLYVSQAVDALNNAEIGLRNLEQLRVLNGRYARAASSLTNANLAKYANRNAPAAVTLLSHAVQNEQRIVQVTAMRDLHSRTLNSLVSLTASVQAYHTTVPTAVSAVVNINANLYSKEKLEDLQRRYQGQHQLLDRIQNTITTLNVHDAPEILPLVDEKLDKLQRLHELSLRYAKNITSGSLAASNIEKGIKVLEEAKTSLASLWDGLTECPLCEQPIENH